MTRDNIKWFADLRKEIIPEHCTGCGACSAACTVPGLISVDPVPKMAKGCLRCGPCYDVCPRTRLTSTSWNKVAGMVYNQTYKPPHEGIGDYLEMVSARSTDPEILKVCQDGGIVSALLKSAFEDEDLDCALAAGIGELPWKPEPMIVTDLEGIIKTAGTKYSLSSVLTKLREAAYKYNRIGVVGTPCQIEGLRSVETFGNDPKYREIDYFLGISIFCMENFVYEDFMVKHVEGTLGIPLTSIKKTDITKGKFFFYTDDKEYSYPIKDFKALAKAGCHYCFDLTGVNSDISVGSIGAPNGWSQVIIRTERAKKIWDRLVEKGHVEIEDVTGDDPLHLDENGESMISAGARMLMRIAASKQNGASEKIQSHCMVEGAHVKAPRKKAGT